MAKPKTPTALALINRRKELGWTQEDLHEALVRETGNELWTTRRVTRIENAEVHVTVEMLVDLALALGIEDVDFLVYGPGFASTQRHATAARVDMASDTRGFGEFEIAEAVSAGQAVAA